MHEELIARSRLLGRGWVAGTLVEISWYPGLVAGEGEVAGELYELINEAATLAFLDRYEGCSATDPVPHEYRRVRMPVRFGASDSVVEAWVYEYLGRVEGRIVIGSDFRAWVQGRSDAGDREYIRE